MVWRCLTTVALLAVLLLGCGRTSAAALEPTARPTEAHAAALPPDERDTVVASGEVVPRQEAQLSFTMSGRVAWIGVAEGDWVTAGQDVARLETELLEAGVAQAEAALATAQAQAGLLQIEPYPEAIAAAQAEIAAAEAAVAQAEALRDQLASGTPAEIAVAEAQLAAAEAEEIAAVQAYEQMEDQSMADWEREATALRLRAAREGRAAAEAQLQLTRLRTAHQVRVAEAAVHTAEAQRDADLAQLALVQVGTTAEARAAAEAAVAQAEAALAAAQIAVAQATLRAPFAGEVIALEVSPGETVMPGQAVLTLADLDHLRVETTDLSERDVTQLVIGQEARVYVEALDVEIEGRVVDIASQATTVGGDVIYAVVIELDEQPPGLRWGMSTEVDIATS
jgi:multidrug resistance efflux pump